jgi:hypothetical protein
MTAAVDKQKRIHVRPIEWSTRPRIIKSKTLVGEVPMTIRRRWTSLCGRYAVGHVLWWHPGMPSEWRTYGPRWTTQGGFYLWLHSEHAGQSEAFEEIGREHRRLHAGEAA